MSEQNFGTPERRTLEFVVGEVAKAKAVPPERRDYVYLYMILEDYIVRKGLYTSEELRKGVREKFNVSWFDPRLGHIFLLKNGDRLALSEVMLEYVMRNAEKVVGFRRLQVTLQELTKGTVLDGMAFVSGRIDMSQAERNMDSPQQSGGHEDLMQAISKLLVSLYNSLKVSIGDSATQKIFVSAFSDLKEKFEGSSTFLDFLRNLPKGVLDTEKFDLLSKEELEKVALEMKRADVMKSEFTNIAAHELKTPIVPLKGFLEMMQKSPEKYGLNDKGREYVEVCVRNVNRLNRLIGDILDISKLEAGEMKFEMHDVDMASMLRNAVTDFSTLAAEKKIELKSSIPTTLPIVNGDPQRLTQVVENLVGNAIKFTDEGHVSVEARMEAADQIRIDISDTGMGIERDNIPRLFTKFFQTQQATTRKTKGTGLGLVICKNIVEAHGGKMMVDSKGLGMGSTFSVVLPAKPL